MPPPTSYTRAHTNIGPEKFSLWEHMKKACKCKRETDKDPARELKRDIHRLEKEYSSSRQRLQKQIIVYTTVADFASGAARSDSQMNKAPADTTKELKRDIHRLEKEYSSSRQSLRKQIIVHKTGKNGFPLTSSNLNISQVNDGSERQPALTYQIPLREVTQQLPVEDLMGGDSAWQARGYPPYCTTKPSQNKKSSCKIPIPANSSPRPSRKSVTFVLFLQRKNI